MAIILFEVRGSPTTVPTHTFQTLLRDITRILFFSRRGGFTRLQTSMTFWIRIMKDFALCAVLWKFFVSEFPPTSVVVASRYSKGFGQVCGGDGWTPILLGTEANEHKRFIYAVDAVCFLLCGVSQTIKTLRKSTPELVLPLIYAYLPLDQSRISRFELIPAIHILIRQYLTPTYREGATFDPVSLVEGAASEVAASFMSRLRCAIDNRSRIDYQTLFGSTHVRRQLSALRTTHWITRLLRIAGTEYNRTQTYSSELGGTCYQFLRYLATSFLSSGVRAVRWAMSARLLDALVSLHGLVQYDETLGPKESDGLRKAVLLVTTLAQHYLVFRSFITFSSKIVRSIEHRRLLVDNPGVELVESFLRLLEERTCLKERMDHETYVCQSPECTALIRTAETSLWKIGDYRRCAGCKFAVYCTRTCQRAHWKSGHKLECRMTKAESWDYLSFQDERFLELLIAYTLKEQCEKLFNHFCTQIKCSSGIKDNVRIDFHVNDGRGNISFKSGNGMGPPGISAVLAPDSCWLFIALPVYEKEEDFSLKYSILKLTTQRGNKSPQTAVTVGAPEVYEGRSFIVWQLNLPSTLHLNTWLRTVTVYGYSAIRTSYSTVTPVLYGTIRVQDQDPSAFRGLQNGSDEDAASLGGGRSWGPVTRNRIEAREDVLRDG
ncbi:hypothetical protein BDZ89DRAFT_1223112 [Hymenopellis radicata]|nr:hypothetical protein BDZ89DRAFT_1223112 [Hymenopellis radicata]